MTQDMIFGLRMCVAAAEEMNADLSADEQAEWVSTLADARRAIEELQVAHPECERCHLETAVSGARFCAGCLPHAAAEQLPAMLQPGPGDGIPF